MPHGLVPDGSRFPRDRDAPDRTGQGRRTQRTRGLRPGACDRPPGGPLPPGPWGHAGAYDSLQAIVEHNIDPIEALLYYDPSQAVLPSRADLDAIDFYVLDDPALLADIAAANEMTPKNLSPEEIDLLVAFLHALTDPASVDLRKDVPLEVPSGIPVAETPADPWPVP